MAGASQKGLRSSLPSRGHTPSALLLTAMPLLSLGTWGDGKLGEGMRGYQAPQGHLKAQLLPSLHVPPSKAFLKSSGTMNQKDRACFGSLPHSLFLHPIFHTIGWFLQLLSKLSNGCSDPNQWGTWTPRKPARLLGPRT